MTNLLGIFSPGATEVTLGLTAFMIIVVGILWYQAFKAAKSGGIQQIPGGQIKDNNPTPVWKLKKFQMGLLVVVLWVVALFFVGRSYRPVDYDKYKVTPVDDGRIPAQDMIQK